MSNPINIFSEIGTLKTVLLKKPGKEVENLTPSIMNRLLFDDIPYLPHAQSEHDAFAKVLRDNGTEVLYLDQLLEESIENKDVRANFIKEFLNESQLISVNVFHALEEYLSSLDNKTLVETMIAGIRKKDVQITSQSIVDLANEDDYPFWMDPSPNLYFTRDFAASIGKGMTINHMTFQARRRDSLLMETIVRNHPRFANQGIDIWLNRDQTTHMEGGDEQILNDHTMAIGISQRSTAQAIENLAKQLFSRHSGFDKIIAVKIPHSHALMHLDTVFTMVDYDKFTIYPGILKNGGYVDIYILEPGKEEGEIKVTHKTDLKAVLEEALGVPEVALIPTGNSDAIVAPREQWNDGSNTLAIAPGVVVTYDRNFVSNKMLGSYGVKVIEIASAELCRGRGGPRCMSMPIWRENLKK